MKISRKVIARWKLLKDHGDVGKIMEETGYSKPTILKAFNGEGKRETVDAINKFYEQRKQELLEKNIV